MLTLVAPRREPALMALEHDGDKFSDGPHHRRASDRRGSLESRVAQLEQDVAGLKDGPTDVRRLNFPASVVLTVVGAALSIGVVLWTVRSDIRNVQTSLDAQRQLFDDRYSALKETIGMMEKKQELQRLEIQGLKEMILRQEHRP